MLFEKEAKEWYNNRFAGICPANAESFELSAIDIFQEAATFGYNKANEQHTGTPPVNKDLLCQVAKDDFEVGYYHHDMEQFYTMDGKILERYRLERNRDAEGG